jgi:hypothetical protein
MPQRLTCPPQRNKMAGGEHTERIIIINIEKKMREGEIR